METNSNLLKEIIELDDKYFLPVFGRRQPLVITHGTGCRLHDEKGQSYLDMIGGIAVNVLGHAHPALTRAICNQAGQLIHCSNYFYNEPQSRLAARLAELSGLAGARLFFGNSGAEVNEAALKLARSFFYYQGQPRQKIVAATMSFHGRTIATATATGQPKYSQQFAPLPEGFVHVPFNDLAALEEAVDENTCALILEPIQGESGVVAADPAYLELAARLCQKTGTRLILDEIQTGLGRTGKFFAFEHYGIKPNIVTLAKGLAGGVPIGAVIADGNTAAGFKPGDHGSTFGGNPLACAAALAVLDTYEKDSLTAQAAQTGQLLLDQLKDLATSQPLLSQIRGKGLMIGIQLARPLALKVKQAFLEKGYLVGSVGDSIIRLLPPLILPQAEIKPFCQVLADILEGVKQLSNIYK